MEGFSKILNPTLVSISRDVLNGVGLTIVQAVDHGILDRLDFVLFVVASPDLIIEGG